MDFLGFLNKATFSTTTSISEIILSTTFNFILNLFEKIILGIFGIFNIFKSNNTELISALVLAIIYTAVITYLIYFFTDYYKTNKRILPKSIKMKFKLFRKRKTIRTFCSSKKTSTHAKNRSKSKKKSSINTSKRQTNTNSKSKSKTPPKSPSNNKKTSKSRKTKKM